eukprot:gene1940-16448_t
MKSGVIDTGIADHRMVYALVRVTRQKIAPKIILVIDWKKFKEDKFKQDIKMAPWHSCNVFEEVDDNLWMNEMLYSDIVKEIIPKRKAKACGPDEITSKELKTESDEMSFSIANICRLRYIEGKYPSQWKIGKIKPAHKQGERAERGNYRPLTMLSLPSKVNESLICDGMEKQIDKTRQNQWAYSKGKSTESILLYLTETWKRHMSKGEVIAILFIDFGKASDCADHIILKQKLIAAGDSGKLYQIIESYLENRKQYVDLNEVKSELKSVAYGVPQGSVLGPRLFSVYMNDLPDITSEGEMHF